MYRFFPVRFNNYWLIGRTLQAAVIEMRKLPALPSQSSPSLMLLGGKGSRSSKLKVSKETKGCYFCNQNQNEYEILFWPPILTI